MDVAPVGRPFVTPARGGEAQIEVHVDVGIWIEGIVRSRDGARVEASVYARTLGGVSSQVNGALVGVSDADGRFSLGPLAPVEHVVWASPYRAELAPTFPAYVRAPEFLISC